MPFTLTPEQIAEVAAGALPSIGVGGTTRGYSPILTLSVDALPVGAMIYGVVTGGQEARRVACLTEAQPVIPELLALAGDAMPGQVSRIVAFCMGGECRRFAGGGCTLARRIVESLDPVVNGPPPRQIRKTCRWSPQEGRAACVRCPPVTTGRASISAIDLWIDSGIVPSAAADLPAAR